MRTLSLIFLAWIVLPGCQRTILDKTPPTITIISPEDESVFSSNGTVIIRASITDDLSIKEVHLDVTNVTLNHKVMAVTISPKEASYELENSFSTTYRTRYEIAIEAEDIDGNVHRQKIYVSSLL